MDGLRFLALAIVVTLTALCADVTATQPTAATLRVATYNINWGNRDLKTMVATIEQADADVVCLQETTKQSEVYLQRNLRESYHHIRFHGHRGRFGAERFGFLSRYPLGKTSFMPPKHGLFGAFVTHVELGGRTVRIVNAHLQPILLPRDARTRDALAALAAMEQTHGKEVTEILDNVETSEPTLIVGDLNSPAAFRAPMVLKKEGFVDSFAQVNQQPESHPTWHWPLKHAEWSLRIDYIFHTPHFRTTESRVIKSDASDHYLVTSELELAAPKP